MLAWIGVATCTAYGGGPKWVAGVSYFNPGVKGNPLHWANGQVQYFVDQGPLGGLSNAQAKAMVDAAAAIWSAVPTAAVTLTDAGSLAEDVNGSNVLAGGVWGIPTLAQPTDVTSAATGTPVAVIFDSDGAVIDALEGTGASQPDNCTQNSVLVWVDGMNPDATLSHGVLVLNGRCTASANLQAMMSFQLERAFGRILGLDFSQVNDAALENPAAEPNGLQGWPVMLPGNGQCGPTGGACIPNPASLRLDDIAALNRIYPVTAVNLASFPGKMLTAANTVAIQGTVAFRTGVGMQGVNVVARPLDTNGNPMYQFTVTAVTGVYFCGNHGNPATGWTDAAGNRLDRFGSDDPALQGYFDLSGIPLPPGMTTANFQVSFEAVNPLYIDAISVGPYLLGSPKPSGTLPTVSILGMQAGSSQTITANAANSAGDAIFHPVTGPIGPVSGPVSGPVTGPITRIPGTNAQPGLTSEMTARGESVRGPIGFYSGTEEEPLPVPANGVWTSRLGQVGSSDWFVLRAKGNRIFTIVTQALDETGTTSAVKAMPAIGVWDGFDLVGSAAAGFAPAQNGFVTGETWLQVATSEDEIVRLGIADQRGDGRPDYSYRGWVLYAQTVSPVRLPAIGGTIVIRGMGFRSGDSVRVGGMAAKITSILPTEITAVVGPEAIGVTGSLDVEVDDVPGFNAIAVIPGGLSYDAASGDTLSIVTAPANQVPLNVPQPFSVLALGADGSPAGGVTVMYSVTGGTATLGCGQNSCAVATTGDGRATLEVTATSASAAVVTASLANGASVQAHFSGAAPATLTALTPTLSLAAGATISWPVQAMVQSGGLPAAGQRVAWASATGVVAPATAVTTDASGIASATLTVGPLAEGQSVSSNACLNGGPTCVAFGAFGARPEFAGLEAVSGTNQSLPVGSSGAPVVMRVLDMDGNPMAGGTVAVYQSLYAWTPPCPPHGRCAQAQLLTSQTTTAISALDGSVVVTPLSMPGVATKLLGLAATGNSASLAFNVEEHP